MPFNFPSDPISNPLQVSPIQPFEFFQPQPQQPAQIVVSEEDGDWWASVWQSGARVALAAVLSISSFQTSQAQVLANSWQDDPAGNLTATVDQDSDYYWQNQVTPVPRTLAYPQQSSFDEQIPAGNLSATVDEYFWPPLPAPIPLTFLPYQQWVGDEQVSVLRGQFDEDFWINPTPPVAGSLQWQQQWIGDEQTPALFPQPDEDFWFNPTRPIAGSLSYPQQWIFDEQFPTLFAQFDEDFWQNPTSPVGLSFLPYSQQAGDEQTAVLSVAPKTYYIPDYVPGSFDRIHCVIDFGLGRTVEFINGQFTTNDPILQALLDAKDGLVSQSVWQGDYKVIPKLRGSSSGRLPREG